MKCFLRIAKPEIKKKRKLIDRGENIMLSLKFFCTISTMLLLLIPAASADSTYDREGFWGGIDAGAGFLKQSFDEEDKDDVYFFLGFKGGYAINPHVLLGLELSGWLLQAEDPSDPDKGEGLMQIFLITQLYPSKEYRHPPDPGPDPV